MYIAVLNATITATICQCHDPSRDCVHESIDDRRLLQMLEALHDLCSTPRQQLMTCQNNTA